MVAVIREMCIFMIVAQAILFFVPGNVYVKYVRVLVGIMMIMGITGPLFGLFMNEEKKQDIRRRVESLEESIHAKEGSFTVPDNRQEVYGAVEGELKERLSACGGDYRVLNAEIAEDKVIVTVEEAAGRDSENSGQVSVQEIRVQPVSVSKEEDAGVTPDGGGKGRELRELYGSRIGVDAENIEVVFQ